jgi:quinol monooxygenase YgiN
LKTLIKEPSQFCKAPSNCLGYRLLRGHEEPENWILIIEWDSVEGHEQGFRKEPAFRDFFALVKLQRYSGNEAL